MTWALDPRAPRTDPRSLLGFKRSATHIRGRVFARGWLWCYEVTNTNTGAVIIADNCADFATIAFQCHQAVAVARGTWMYSLTRNHVS